ncbi:hypothetical protein TWF506_001196 [Arthrobotrys conoides]|uniref:Uncharacterized protein n=1 Tax=Arthrobotrys conoides TaxID=74498 RepID=A0AAN8NN34_9PEZI
MYLRSIVLALGAISISAVSATEKCARAVCNADNCLRALRATNTPTRLAQASADCTRIIDVTYTPPVVTKTEYSTISQTDTSTIPSTLVKSFSDTQTDVIQATATTDLLTTITIQANIEKRVATSTSISFPSYATPCSGFYRFSSACSCIGVTPRIITVTAPSTTVTIPVTETIVTSVTQVVDTTSVTITDATISVTTTATTVTNTIATTVNVNPPEVSKIGKIYSSNNNFLNAYVGGYVSSVSGADMLYTSYITDVNAAIPLRLDSNGNLWSGNKVAKGNPQSSGAGALQFFFVAPEVATESRQPFVCTEGSNSFLNCVVGPQSPPTKLGFTVRENNNIYSSSHAIAVANARTIYQIKLE